MKARFTEEDLVLYLYGELSTSDCLALKLTLENNPAMMQALKSLEEMKDVLDYGLMEPDPTTIDLIMEHGHLEELPH